MASYVVVKLYKASTGCPLVGKTWYCWGIWQFHWIGQQSRNC